jgi:DNA-binding response OmpR family regulator
MSEGKRILIVEDEVKIVEVVKSYLESNGYQVVAANNGKYALEVFDKLNPSLVILDLMLPDVSGEEVCLELRKKSRVPILMLTARVDEESILNGFNLGADDYVTKPFSPRQIVARVRALIRRSDDDIVPLTNIISFCDEDLVVDSIKHEVRKSGKVVYLTPNEYKILMTMIKYPKKAFTREELVCMALGEDYDGFDRVIDTHIKNLRQKIETNPRSPKYFLTIHGIGYRFGGE